MKECGIFGIWGRPDAAKADLFQITRSSAPVRRRGQDRFQMMRSQLKRYRDTGLLSEVFKILLTLDKLTGNEAIGHVFSYATAGEASVDNIQPFLFPFMIPSLDWLTTNLTNAKSLNGSWKTQGDL